MVEIEMDFPDAGLLVTPKGAGDEVAIELVESKLQTVFNVVLTFSNPLHDVAGEPG